MRSAMRSLKCDAAMPDRTAEILDVVELAYGHRKGPTEALIRQLRSELYWAQKTARTFSCERSPVAVYSCMDAETSRLTILVK